MLSSLLDIFGFEIRFFKFAVYIFLIIHDVFFRSVPIFMIEHVSGWDFPSGSLVMPLQVSRKLGKRWEKIQGVCMAEKSVWAECCLTWLITYIICSKCSFVTLQPYITLTIGDFFFFSNGSGKSRILLFVYLYYNNKNFFVFHVSTRKSSKKKNSDKMHKKELSGISHLISLSAVFEMSIFWLR